MPTDTPPVDPRLAALAELPLYTPTRLTRARVPDGIFNSPSGMFRGKTVWALRTHGTNVVFHPGSTSATQMKRMAEECRAADEYLARRRVEKGKILIDAMTEAMTTAAEKYPDTGGFSPF